jgi:hypothetical protein
MLSPAEELFDNLSLLYRNIYNLLNGFQQASITSNSSIVVPIEKVDGTFENVTINSFQKLQQELTRIDSNFKSLLNGDNLSYVLDSDGSISQLTKTSFINAEYLENFTFDQGNTCFIDKTSIINDLIFPNVKIPVTIDSNLQSDIFSRIFEITDGWSQIPENPTILDIEYLLSTGKIIAQEYIRSLKLEKEQVQYFGKFTIESIIPNQTSNNIFSIILNEIKYTGLNTIGNSIELKVGDIFVSKAGASKYIINEIDKVLKSLVITRISGSEVLSIGIDALYYNEILTNDKKIVGISVKPNQTIVAFLSTENFKNISYPSKGIKINTATYQVIYKEKTYTLDEFFSTYVLNFSEYLMAFINESTIPVHLGITPTKPVLDPLNFKFIQINKHLSNAKSVTEIEELNKSKQAIQNDIDFKQKLINKIQLEIDTLKFKSLTEKNYKLSQIINLRQDILTLKSNILSITQDFDSNATRYGLKSITPKYKVIGFWQIQNPSYSPLTALQHIIKYEVNYRYLSKDTDTIENTSYKMVTTEGKSVSVAFSPWSDLRTKTLQKIKNLDGLYEWQTEIIDSVDEININQLAISITEGEAIEIKIRAVSEAGYPIAPLMSEWSDILRLEFPNELKQSNITSTISQNNIDLNKAQFDAILQNYGLVSHISGTIKEGEKTFLHSAKDIASGQFTAEQKNIPLDTVITDLMKEIAYLKAGNSANNVLIQLVDFNNEVFNIKNNTTMELFAGNYSDNISLLDKTSWGSIIRKKGYIKIQNNNSVPIEIKTLIPGTIFDSIKAPIYYNIMLKNVNKLSQDSKQIIYFRNIDLTGQPTEPFKLVTPRLPFSVTEPNANDIDDLAIDIDRNIIYRDIENNIVKCKLNPTYNTNFVAFTTEHPQYGTVDLKTEFDRLKLYTYNVKAKQFQTEYNSDGNNLLGFADNDFFAVGQKTCGAFLYPIISNIASISVIGDTAVSTMIIPKELEILIPFVFEYRMIDRIGNIDGILNQDANTILEYSKKIGIDMMINNELFKFDINVTSKLKSKILTTDSLNISSVVTNFNNETSSNLI